MRKRTIIYNRYGTPVGVHETETTCYSDNINLSFNNLKNVWGELEPEAKESFCVKQAGAENADFLYTLLNSMCDVESNEKKLTRVRKQLQEIINNYDVGKAHVIPEDGTTNRFLLELPDGLRLIFEDGKYDGFYNPNGGIND